MWQSFYEMKLENIQGERTMFIKHWFWAKTLKYTLYIENSCNLLYYSVKWGFLHLFFRKKAGVQWSKSNLPKTQLANGRAKIQTTFLWLKSGLFTMQYFLPRKMSVKKFGQKACSSLIHELEWSSVSLMEIVRS